MLCTQQNCKRFFFGHLQISSQVYFALHCIVSNIIPEAPSVRDKIRSIFVVQNTFTDVAI